MPRPVRTVRVENDLWHQLEMAAALEGQSTSEYLRTMIASNLGSAIERRNAHSAVAIDKAIEDVAKALDSIERGMR